MQQEKWELFSHKADMGIRGRGPTYEKAFEQAALALTGILMDPDQIKPEVPIQIVCEAPSMDILFYDWINELVYEMAYRHLIFNKFHVNIIQNQPNMLSLKGEAFGEIINQKKHKLAVEIKGATFTELKTKINKEGQCLVQCVVDI